MKKLVFMFIGLTAMTLAACGNGAKSTKSVSDTDTVVTDSADTNSVHSDSVHTLVVDSVIK